MNQGQWQDSGDSADLQQVDEFNAFTILEKGRYHLYVSYGCPFAHRAVLAVSVLGLADYVSVSSVDPIKTVHGWEFSHEHCDPLQSKQYLNQVYKAAKNDYSGRVSVPVLWDKKLKTIVSNDSLKIALWLAKQEVARATLDLIPATLEADIATQCQWINSHINLLPFKAGFTADQAEYEQASSEFFKNLSSLDNTLAKHQFFNGNALTLCDVLIVPTLIQMDLVYATHFKLNFLPLNHFKHITKYLTALMSYQSISATFHIDFIKTTYFMGQPHINPSKIIPTGLFVDSSTSHWLNAKKNAAPILKNHAQTHSHAIIPLQPTKNVKSIPPSN